MKFIELHRHPDGLARMLNLDDILEVRVGQDGEHAVIELRAWKEPLPLPVRESYTQIRNMLAAAKALVQ